MVLPMLPMFSTENRMCAVSVEIYIAQGKLDMMAQRLHSS